MSKQLAPQTPTEIAVSTVTEMLHGERKNSFNESLFDEICELNLRYKMRLDVVKEQFEQSREQVRKFVDLYGHVPSEADKTLRCESSRFQASVTRAVGTEIDDSRVEEVQSVLRRARIPKMFPRLFTRKVTYSLAADAQKVLNTVHIPAKFREAFFAVYALCFTPAPKSPSVTVVDLVAQAEQLAQKQAAKDAKAAAKKAGKRGGKEAA